MKIDNAQDAQAEITTKTARRNELAREAREALAGAAQARRDLVNGDSTAQLAAEAQTKATILGEALKEIENDIAGLELEVQRRHERAELESKAIELKRLAELATEQFQTVDTLRCEAVAAFFAIAGKIIDAEAELSSTRDAFGRGAGVHNAAGNSGLSFSAHEIWRLCGIVAPETNSILRNYSGDKWSAEGKGMELPLFEALRAAHRLRGTQEFNALNR